MSASRITWLVTVGICAVAAIVLRLSPLTHPAQSAVDVTDFHVAFWAIGLIGLFGVWQLSRLPPTAGDVFRREWFEHLQERIDSLSRLGHSLQRNPRTVQGCSPDFLEALFPDLFRELRAMQDGTPLEATPAWTLACSRQFAAEQEAIEPGKA